MRSNRDDRTTDSSLPMAAGGGSTVWHDYAGRRYESSPRIAEPVGRRPSRFGSFWRGVAGALAAGTLVLAVVLLGVQMWAGGAGVGGPGVPVVVTHFAAALLALVFCAVADRRRDGAGALCCFLVYVCVIGAIWISWWV